MTQSDAARRVRQVDGRMLFAVLAGLSIALVVEAPARALEFTADLITHAMARRMCQTCTTRMIAGAWNIRTSDRWMGQSVAKANKWPCRFYSGLNTTKK